MAAGPSVGDAAEFARAFPFHLVITSDLDIAGFGDGLARVSPSLAPGMPLDQHFTLREPSSEASWALFAGARDQEFCLVHRTTLLELRGRMVLADDTGPLIFLGRSWLEDAEQLADFGVVGAPSLALRPTNAASSDIFAGARPDDPEGLADRCRRLEGCLRLQHVWSRVLVENTNVASATSALVDLVPMTLKWAGGAMWTRVGTTLAAASVRPADWTPPEGLRALCEHTFRNGLPSWTGNSCDDCGGFAIPLNGDNGTIAVLGFVSRQAEPDEHELRKLLFQLSGQASLFLARQSQGEKLARLSSELQAIFQLSADGFVAFNGAGTLSYVNTAFARMTGFDRDDLRGLDEAGFEGCLARLLDPNSPAGVAGNGDPVIQLKHPRTTVLQRSQRDARDLDGRLVGRVLYFRDITLETDLIRANGEFLANAAHELRTPMASIHGFVDLLSKRSLPAEKQQHVLDTLRQQSSRLIGIVNELLDVARFDARAARELRRVRQPLGAVVRSALDALLVSNDPRRVETALPADDTSPWVEVDRDRCIQAITNVVANAYKYSPDGGTIRLALVKRATSELRWVGITVVDHGIGMTADELSHLFDRFFRAHPSGAIPGTGLGMSMVKKIVEAHGGSVDVRSAPGRGTEVTLWFPEIEAE